MELIPAIDILGGKVVRLEQGRYDAVTYYGDDPAEMARSFEAQGATRLHVVDLDGARSGTPSNVSAIAQILGSTSLKVQVGGGVRSEDAAQRWFDAGVKRVVLGTMAIKAPDEAQRICQRWPKRVIVAVDARNGRVAVEGWIEESDRDAEDLAREVDAWGLAGILYTNIEKDGMRSGPDVVGTAKLQEQVTTTVIASGGIGSLDHVLALCRAGVRAAVCGRALYSGAFGLQEAFEALEAAGC